WVVNSPAQSQSWDFTIELCIFFFQSFMLFCSRFFFSSFPISLFLAMEGMVKFQTERVNTEVAVSQFISVRMSKRPLTKMLDTIMEEECDLGVDQTLRSPIYKSSPCHLTQDYRAGQSC
ncbi:unnamed protein product, partial [Prunus brigantina]